MANVHPLSRSLIDSVLTSRHRMRITGKQTLPHVRNWKCTSGIWGFLKREDRNCLFLDSVTRLHLSANIFGRKRAIDKRKKCFPTAKGPLHSPEIWRTLSHKRLSWRKGSHQIATFRRCYMSNCVCVGDTDTMLLPIPKFALASLETSAIILKL